MMETTQTSKRSLYLLASVIIARSTSFLFSKLILQSVSPLSLLSMRFLLAFLLLLLLFHRQMRTLSLSTLKKGALLGLVFTGVMTFELLGLRSTGTSVASFLENSAVVIVPILHGLISRRFPSAKVCCGCALALGGVFLLTLFASANHLSTGVLFCLLAALLYSAAILLTDRFARTEDPLQLGVVQVGCIGALSLLLAGVTGTCSFVTTPVNYLYIVFLAVVCSGFGFTLQPLAQKHVDVDTAGMLCALNPLSCTILGVVILHETCSLPSLLGCCLILFGILLPHLTVRHMRPCT